MSKAVITVEMFIDAIKAQRQLKRTDGNVFADFMNANTELVKYTIQNAGMSSLALGVPPMAGVFLVALQLGADLYKALEASQKEVDELAVLVTNTPKENA